MTVLSLRINETLNEKEKTQYQEILDALVVSGGLRGVKAGRTILHFDHLGIFQGIELDYWPFRRRKKTNEEQKSLQVS